MNTSDVEVAPQSAVYFLQKLAEAAPWVRRGGLAASAYPLLLLGLAPMLLMSAARLSGNQRTGNTQQERKQSGWSPAAGRCPQLSGITDPGVPIEEREGWWWGPPPGTFLDRTMTL